MLNKFKISKNDDESFNVESKVSGNRVVVEQQHSTKPKDVLLWTILNDLHEEGLLGDS